MKKVFKTNDWVPYLTRPFDLFITSLWQSWYESRHMLNALDFKMDDVLCIEVSKNLVSQYRTRSQLELLKKNYTKLIKERPKKLKKLLRHGLKLGLKAKFFLKKGPGSFVNLREALNFFNELTFYTTVFPNFPSIVLNPSDKLPPTIARLTSELRSVSYYTPFLTKIIHPLVLKHLKTKGVRLSGTKSIMLTQDELWAKNVPNILKNRYKNKDKKFVYKKIKGTEHISWTLNVISIIKTIEGNTKNKISIIKGVGVFPGKVKAKAHVVLDFTNPGSIKKGEILVSINSNPNLLTSIKKASALITDEGGITSHGAIISREFKIPCIIGTKVATKLIKEGDVIELDANSGIIKLKNYA